MNATTPRTTDAESSRARRDQRCEPLTITTARESRDIAAWAAFLDDHADAAVFHHPDWCGAVADVFGHADRSLLARRGPQVVGVLPLMLVRSWVAGRLLVSVPYGTYGGMLTDDAEAAAALADAAGRLAQRERAVLELRSASARVPQFSSIDGYLGFRRTLPATPDAVSSFLPKRARAAARHARDREGVEIVHGVEHLSTAWVLYCRSMRRLGSLSYPKVFFERLAERFGVRLSVALAVCAARPLCGTICLRQGDVVLPYVLGADERESTGGAANLLYWSAMERAVAAGARVWDYGRSRSDNAGAVGFKKNQGFEPTPLGYQRYVPPGLRAADLNAGSPRFALARRLWPRLPLAVAVRVGGWLARSIPG